MFVFLNIPEGSEIGRMNKMVMVSGKERLIHQHQRVSKGIPIYLLRLGKKGYQFHWITR